MALFQSLGIVALLTVMSSNHTRYGITGSRLILEFCQEPSGPIGLFLPITASHFLIVLMLMVKGSPK